MEKESGIALRIPFYMEENVKMHAVDKYCIAMGKSPHKFMDNLVFKKFVGQAFPG